MNAPGATARTARALLVSRLLPPAASFVLLVAIGRQSDVLLGQYAVATTFLFVLQTLPLLGLTPFVMREAARSPQAVASLFATVGSIAIAACLVINALLQPLLSVLPYGADVLRAIRLTGVGITWGILAFLVEILLVALQRPERVAAAAVAEHLTRLLASGLVLWLDGGVTGLVACALGARLLTLLLLGPALWSHCAADRALRWSKPLALRIASVLPVFLLSTVLALVMSRCDFLVLSAFRSAVEVGHYAIAYRLLEIALIAVTTVATALFPRYALLYRQDPRRHADGVRRDIRWAVVATTCLAFVCWVAADRYVAWLFARQYPQPVGLAHGFAALLAVAGLDVYLSNVLNAADRQGADVRAQGLGALAYAGCLFAFVPAYGAQGALWATAIAYAVQLAARGIALSAAGWPIDARRALLPLVSVALLVFGGASALLHDRAWFLQWALGAAALGLYGVFLFGSGLLGPPSLGRMRFAAAPSMAAARWVRGLAAWRGRPSSSSDAGALRAAPPRSCPRERP